MKRVFISAMLLLSAMVASARPPTTEQVEQYLAISRTQEAVQAQADGFSKQYATTATPKQMEQINRYLDSVLGWKAVKEEYTHLVQEIYTEEEIKAALAFTKSSMGQSIARKNQVFSSKASALVAKRVQAFAQGAQKPDAPDREEQPSSTESLEAVGVERHLEADRLYFTGKVINKGKAPARGIQVEINLFAGPKFVDQYTTYISGAIPAGGERYFKVSCGCKDAQPAAHDSHRTSLISTY
jgi:hypothetical protein